eukprot:gnl/TRDRNA2_/TRDRNA2_65759_c0_seq1.p1 gnl/TRDRNA2_/TRDRNA2_65759_c0~~gnl/TRDRNA2_/TRDRNA2_65759_c0_seq1.p1  ORF type:complete len:588 (+),score=75.99 gnl/TRDRNA2_/TRDRNA2_65759_c0_seq1:60-1823(+)
MHVEVVMLRFCVYLAAVTLFVYAFHLGAAVVHNMASIAAVSDAVKLVSSLMKSCRFWQAGDDSLQGRVAVFVRARRLERCKSFTGHILPILALYTLHSFWQRFDVYTSLVSFEEMSAKRIRKVERYAERDAFILLAFALSYVLFLKIFHTRLTLLKLEVGQVLCVCRLATQLLNCNTLVKLSMNSRLSDYVVLLLGVVISNVRLTFCLQLVLSIVKIYSWLSLDPEASLQAAVAREMFAFIIVVGTTYLSDFWLRTEAVLALELGSSKKSEAMVQMLVSGLCDAVVHLGPDLHISMSAPKLASMLLRDASGSSLLGCSFPDLMTAEDAETFRQQFEEGNPEDHTRCVNVHLRDVVGTLVRVKLFCCSFHGFGDNTSGHILGICELCTDSAPRASEEELHIRVAGSTGVDCDIPSASSGSTSDGSGLDVAMPLRRDGKVQQDLAVAFEVPSVGFWITECTVPFVFWSGTEPGGLSLLDWVVEKDHFSDWVQESANIFINDLTRMPVSSASSKFTFRFPLGVKLGLEFRVLAVLSFSEMQSSSVASDAQHLTEWRLRACLTIKKVRTRSIRHPPVSPREESTTAARLSL